MKDKSGMVLVTVVCFTAVLAVLAAGLMMESSTQMKLFRRQSNMEQALYTAEAGAEHLTCYVLNGGAVPGVLNGTMGNGEYTACIMDEGTLTGFTNDTHSISGYAKINPNNSPQNEFTLVTGNGVTITRDDLHQDQEDFTATAVYIRLKPAGNGNQNTLVVDGVALNLQNSQTYTFSGTDMQVSVWNDNRNPQGKAMGKWYISIDSVSIEIDDGTGGSSSFSLYRIVSIGRVEGLSRGLVIDGLHQQSWAKYALWYNTDAYGCWFKGGEKFYGPVHANCQVNFNADPEFFKPLSSAQGTYGGSTNAVTFHEGFELNAACGNMADVTFTGLQAQASLIVTGRTSVTLAQTNILVTNTRMGWSNHAVSVQSAPLLYVETASSGAETEGWCEIGGELSGRLTVVTEHDIRITDHVTYSTHPTNNSADALGLIANRNVCVASSCPNNVNVYAHIMATGNITPVDHTVDGKFWVENYNLPPARGTLTVYGGIVQDTRGPVGLFDSFSGVMYSGFEKNYSFDPRFETDPPPQYPSITNEYEWTSWRDTYL